MQADLGPFFDEVLGQAMASIADRYKTMGVNLSWEVFDQAAADWAKTYQYDLVKDLNDTTRQQLGQAVSRWIASDEDFGQLVDRVRRITPPNQLPNIRDRGQVIAATEVTRVYADSRIAGMKAAGFTKMRWRIAHDELVCPICRPLGMADGGKGALGDVATGKFTNPENGLQYSVPGHVNCRCWLVEDTDELEQAAAVMPEAPIEAAPLPEPPIQAPAVVRIRPPAPAPMPVPPPKPAVPWAPGMTADEADKWAEGSVYAGRTFYSHMPAKYWELTSETGMLWNTEMVYPGLGGGMPLDVTPGKPPGKTQIVVPVKVNVKKPFFITDAQELNDLKTMADSGGYSFGVSGYLQAGGFDSVAWTDAEGKLLSLDVLDPFNKTLVVDADGKPAGVTLPAAKPAKPKVPKAPKTVPAPAELEPPPSPSGLYDLPAMDVSHDMLLARDLHAKGSPWGPAGKSNSYGAVMFDDQGRVLLRKPTNEFGGYVWTWPKGGVEPDEHPLTAALREVGKRPATPARRSAWCPVALAARPRRPTLPSCARQAQTRR